MALRILLCTPQEKSPYLGISRVLIEIAVGLRQRGHHVNLLGPEDLGILSKNFDSRNFRKSYAKKLKDYILKHSDLYDVIDYDHEYLPYKRSTFPEHLLLVARTVLLAQHLKHISPLRPWSLRFLLGKVKRYAHLKMRLRDTDITTSNADLVNVPNDYDARYLESCGYAKDKVVVIPYGLSKERLSHFEGVKKEIPSSPQIVFLGSFDYRKGAAHFNALFKAIKKSVPDATFLLLGCGGMLKSRDEVLSFFDSSLHVSIETVFKFEREKIGEHLKGGSVGIYPSYMEGFPFGVLEMMVGFIPVVVFDAPGAPMMVPKDQVVAVGDEQEMANKVIELIHDKELLQKKRTLSKELALTFTWERICKETEEAYKRSLSTT